MHDQRHPRHRASKTPSPRATRGPPDPAAGGGAGSRAPEAAAYHHRRSRGVERTGSSGRRLPPPPLTGRWSGRAAVAAAALHPNVACQRAWRLRVSPAPCSFLAPVQALRRRAAAPSRRGCQATFGESGAGAPNTPRRGALRVRKVARLALQPVRLALAAAGAQLGHLLPRPPRTVAVLAFQPGTASTSCARRPCSRCPQGRPGRRGHPRSRQGT